MARASGDSSLTQHPPSVPENLMSPYRVTRDALLSRHACVYKHSQVLRHIIPSVSRQIDICLADSDS